MASFRLVRENFKITLLTRSCTIWKLRIIKKTQHTVFSEIQALFKY